MQPASTTPLVHNDSEEVIQIVDINDKPVGSATRGEMREKKLPHRCTYVMLENAKTGKLYMHKRSMLKKWCPGHWDVAFGGVVQFQESYEDNALRELEEEAGVKEELIPLFSFLHNVPPSIPTWGKVFYARTLQNLTLQKEEVDEVVEMSIEELKKNQTKDGAPIAQDSKMALDLFLQDFEKYHTIIENSKKSNKDIWE